MKKWFLKQWYSFNDDLDHITNKQWKIILLSTVGTVLALVAFFLFVPTIQKNIRQSQISSVVFATKEKSPVKTIPYGKLAETLRAHKEATVLFIPNNSKYQKEIEKKLYDEKAVKDLNNPLYVYPMIYDTKEDSKKYQLDVNYVTAIYFEDGVEESRHLFKKEKAVKNLIDTLNQKAMENMKEFSE